MARPKNTDEPSGNFFRFNLFGLIVFSLALVTGTALVTGKLFNRSPKIESHPDADIPAAADEDKNYYTRKGPWGELLLRNIKLERPRELIAMEAANPPAEKWVFKNATPAAVQALLAASGFTPEQAAQAVAKDHVSQEGADTVLTPDDEFILSLSAETREKFFTAMYGRAVNKLIDYPYIFPGVSVETIYADTRLDPSDVAVFKKMTYRAGSTIQFSDYETLIRLIPTVPRRIAMARTLSRQSAVLARLCVRPDSDIDKIAGYWGHMDNVHFNDIRPLLESLRELPQGGTISIMYLLPPFARERLYTYPIPKPGDPLMDCHWSTFNFSNLQLDNRFNDTAFTSQFIQNYFYPISEPAVYGDVILLSNGKSEIKHSAVYLATDLAFTKYGNNDRQPWMLVHIADMLAEYPGLKPLYFRHRTD
jgi:hypothetical protein